MTDLIVPPAGLVEHVGLPDVQDLPAQGRQLRYERSGRRRQDGPVIVVHDGLVFVWARFADRVRAGQRATMRFTNLFGNGQIGATATEWDVVLDRPTIGPGLVDLLAASRGVSDAAVVCRNHSPDDLDCAVGLTLILG